MRKFLTLILAIFLVLPVSAQVGCCELRRSVTDSIWTISQTHPDGFTVNVRTMTVPTEGICVAYSATQDSHGRDALEEVISHATQHDGFVGGWMDPSDSLYYFDSVRVFPEDSLEAAINFCKAHFQKAVYRLSTSEEIILKEDLEWVSPTNLNRRGTGPHLSPYRPGEAPDGSPLIGSDKRTCSCCPAI